MGGPDYVNNPDAFEHEENAGLGFKRIIGYGSDDTGTAQPFLVDDEGKLQVEVSFTPHATTHTNGDDDIQDATASQKGLMTSAYATKLDGIETGATADQTDAEIETAYNNQVDVVPQAEAEAGTSTTVRRWTAERVKQAIDALGGAGDVTGPGSAVDDRIATFNGTTGKIIQDGLSTIADVLNRSNHTGTQTASTISDFVATVQANSSHIVDFDYIVGTTSDPQTSATSTGTTLAEMTKTFTPSSASNWILVFFSGQFENDSKKNDRGAYCGIEVDNTLEAETERGTSLSTDDPDYPGHVNTFWAGQLSAASHTVDVTFWGSGDDTIGKDTQRALLFFEIEL